MPLANGTHSGCRNQLQKKERFSNVSGGNRGQKKIFLICTTLFKVTTQPSVKKKQRTILQSQHGECSRPTDNGQRLFCWMHDVVGGSSLSSKRLHSKSITTGNQRWCWWKRRQAACPYLTNFADLVYRLQITHQQGATINCPGSTQLHQCLKQEWYIIQRTEGSQKKSLKSVHLFRMVNTMIMLTQSHNLC